MMLFATEETSPPERRPDFSFKNRGSVYALYIERADEEMFKLYIEDLSNNACFLVLHVFTSRDAALDYGLKAVY